eukprot:407952_1
MQIHNIIILLAAWIPAIYTSVSTPKLDLYDIMMIDIEEENNEETRQKETVFTFSQEDIDRFNKSQGKARAKKAHKLKKPSSPKQHGFIHTFLKLIRQTTPSKQ